MALASTKSRDGRRVNRLRAFSLSLGRICRAFLKDDDGQAVIEYILLLSMTVIGAGFLARGILNALDNGVLKLGGQLEKDLKTGRAPLSVYQN
jgi:Flp pilus assembly pilin Flp